jgi:hypothetical protein
MHRAFSQYRAYAGPLDRVRKGALVSMAGARGCTATRHCKPKAAGAPLAQPHRHCCRHYVLCGTAADLSHVMSALSCTFE